MTIPQAGEPDEVYRGLEPAEVWRHFAALNRIPRPSGQEQAALTYVREAAKSAGCSVREDSIGNLVVEVPARGAEPGAPAVAVQAHLDMVCERRPEVTHDFERDPIRPRRVDGRIYASGTTLGADNGLGAAMALALLTTSSLRHGPLDLLFTVQEETGLIGAMSLDPALLQARLLINLDSEEPGELIVGCAGGGTSALRLKTPLSPVPEDAAAMEVRLGGLHGGHSGVQIHEPLANAIKLLTALLLQGIEENGELRLISFGGGNARNAIPRDAVARLCGPAREISALEQSLRAGLDRLRAIWAQDEPGLTLQVEAIDTPPEAMEREESEALLALLDELPHGPLEMSSLYPGKVQTSANLAVVTGQAGALEIVVSVRSFRTADIRRIMDDIAATAAGAGAELKESEIYGGWEPDPGSPLTAVAEQAAAQIYGHPPRIDVIHAGLECGAIAARVPGLQAISFGPRIRGAHTPEEWVEIATVEETWRLLTRLLSSLTAGQMAG